MSRTIRTLVYTLILIAIALSSFGCTPSAPEEEKTKIGFVFLEGVDAIGWSKRANIGRLAVEEAFPNVQFYMLTTSPSRKTLPAHLNS